MSPTTELISITGTKNPNRKADIIFVHGLGGDAKSTWHPEERTNDDRFWPMWLGKDLSDVGIWSLAYQVEPFKKDGHTMSLKNRATNVLSLLNTQKIGERPVLFITHSMGGLLVKQIFCNIYKCATPEGKKISEQTKGIVFISTPHSGSDIGTWLDFMEAILGTSESVKELKANNSLLKELNEYLRKNHDFAEIAIQVFYETKKTSRKKKFLCFFPITLAAIVVSEDSADPKMTGVEPIPLDEDHLSICRPKSQDAHIYLDVKNFIEKCLSNSESIIDSPNQTSQSEPSQEIVAPNNTPHSSVKFVGREEELEYLKKIDRTLERNSITKATFISGIGGVGKTELAIQYAKRYKDDYPGGICWLEQGNKDDIGTQIVEFTRTHLGLDPQGDILSNKVDYCWQHWNIEGDVLVVVDNVTEYGDIEVYLNFPISKKRFKVLVIRLERSSSDEIIADPLRPLTLESALELLESTIGKKGRNIVEKEKEEANKLCKFLDYLPLALHLVGKYINHISLNENIALSKINQDLKKWEEEILGEKNEEWIEENQLDVYTVFSISWEQLKDEERFFGCLFGLFSEASIPYFLIKTTAEQLKDWNRLEFRKIPPSLIKLNLIESDKEKKNYKVHGIIQRFLKSKLEKLPEVEQKQIRQQFFEVIVEEAQKIPDTPVKQDLDKVRLSIPHIIKAGEDRKNWLLDENKKNKSDNLTAEYRKLVDLYRGLGRFYDGGSYYYLAEKYYKEGLSIAEKHLDKFDPDVLKIQNALADVYVSRQEFGYAKDTYYKAQQHGEEWLKTPENTPKDETYNKVRLIVATSQDGLGYVLCRSFYQPPKNNADSSKTEFLEKEETESLLNTALETREEIYKQLDHLDITTSLNHLGFFHRIQQQWKESASRYQEALDMRKRLEKKDSPSIATSLHNLATCYHESAKQLKENAKSQYEKAEAYYQESLNMWKNLYGEKHLQVATVSKHLAEVYKQMQQYDQAKKYYLQTYKITKQFLGTNLDTVNALIDLAVNYQELQKFDEANRCYQEALAQIEKITKKPSNLKIIEELENEIKHEREKISRLKLV